MSAESENPKAFPRSAFNGGAEPGDPYSHNEQDGMTLRDYFAAAALQAILSTDEYSIGQAVDQSFQTADLMLKARKNLF